jgi:hypothetical protein
MKRNWPVRQPQLRDTFGNYTWFVSFLAFAVVCIGVIGPLYGLRAIVICFSCYAATVVLFYAAAATSSSILNVVDPDTKKTRQQIYEEDRMVFIYCLEYAFTLATIAYFCVFSLYACASGVAMIGAIVCPPSTLPKGKPFGSEYLSEKGRVGPTDSAGPPGLCIPHPAHPCANNDKGDDSPIGPTNGGYVHDDVYNYLKTTAVRIECDPGGPGKPSTCKLVQDQ